MTAGTTSVRDVVMLTNAVTPDQLGGLQRYVRELSAALVRRDVAVRIVTRRVSGEHPLRELGDDGVQLLRYEVPPRSSPMYAAGYPLAALRAAWRGARAGERAGAVVHVHYSLPGIAPALGRLPYVQTFHAPAYKEIAAERQGRYALPAEDAAVVLLRAGERMLVRRARRIAVLSDFMLEEVRRLDADAAGKVASIPGGMDTTWFSPGSPVDHPFARGDGPLLFTARRFVPRTGVEALVEAMPAVLDAVPDARLAVCGDGPLRSQVEQRIAAAGLGDRVLLLGRVTDDELLGWYRAADLFVMPTQALEGFGLAAAEALACGTPAVGTNAGAVPEVLAPLDPRLVAGGHEAPALAAAIVRVLSTPGLLADVAQRARAHVHPLLSWDAVAERYLDLYARAA